MEYKAPLFCKSWRRQGPFKKAEYSKETKHSAKDGKFLCEGQLAVHEMPFPN